MVTVHETTVDGSETVTLKKIGKRFVVVYGDQLSRQLSYAEAAKEYGECIMDALQCTGLLD